LIGVDSGGAAADVERSAMADDPFAEEAVVGAQSGPPPEQPSWLTQANDPSQEDEMKPSWLKPAAEPARIDEAPVPGDTTAGTTGPPPMDISCFKLPKEIAAMRGLNVISSFLLALLAALKLEQNGSDVSSGVISIYIFAFAFVLFIFETHLSFTAKIIAENLGFMYRATGRFCFMLLLGMLCFSNAPMAGLGYFVGIWVILTACFNGFIFFKFPDYERSCRIVDLGE